MKRTNRKFLLLAVSFLLTAMVFLTMPVASMAADTYYEVTEKNLVVSATNIVIDSADANGAYSPTYEMTFIADNASFSAYEMSFRMPYFVNVQSVCATPKMDGMTNATFTYYVDDSGLINVSYSCAENTNNVDIFTVYFTVNDYSVNIGSVDFYDAHFVDVNVNDVPVSFTYSTIEITNQIVMGDVDNDGIVTLSDLLIIQQSMVNPYYGLTERQFTAADIDKDGYITIRDCQYIQNYLVGRLGSLDNVVDKPDVPSQYIINVVVTNEIAEELFSNAITVSQGMSYSTVANVTLRMLYKNYDVEKILRAYSDRYGIIDIENSGDAYTVESDDRIVITVQASPKQQPAKFSHSITYTYEDGSYMVVNSYFYYDGTALFTMERFVDGNVVETADQRCSWYLEGNYIIVAIPDMGEQIMFVVGEDGNTLYPYDGGNTDPDQPIHKHRDMNDDYSCDYCGEWCDDGHDVHYDNDNDAHCDFCGSYLGGYGCAHRDADDNYICDYCGTHWDDGQDVWEEQDYIQGVKHEIVIGITVGTDPSVFMEMACENYFTVHYSISGEKIVYLTPDMIDYSSVDFNTVGNYRAHVTFKTENGVYNFGFDVCVMPDMSEVGVRGVYSFSEEIREIIEINTLTLYADGTLIIDNFYVTSYFEIEEDVIVFGIEGGDLVVRLNDESETVDFYVPTEDTFIGEYTYFYKNGPTIVFTVYGDYTGAGDYVALYEIGYDGYYMCVTTRVFLDLGNNTIKHGSLDCDTIITEDNVIIDNHEIVVRVEAPTCDWYGYEIHECNKCGRQVSRVEIAPLGHTFNEEDICVNCGYSNKVDGELESVRAEILCKMDEEWSMLFERYGDIVTKFERQYMIIRDNVFYAPEIYIINEHYEEFMALVQTIHDKLGNTEAGPMNWHLMNPTPATVTQGDSIEDFIDNYIVNNILVIYMSDGQVLHVTVDRTMITGYSDFSTPGYTYISMHCATGSFSIGFEVSVNVLPDLSGEILIGEFYFNDTIGSGWGNIFVYENGMMVTDGEVYYYYWYRDDVIAVDMSGAPIFLTLNFEGMCVEFYKPEGPVFGIYTMYMGDNALIFTVYGEYHGYDSYIAEITMRYGDGEGGIKQEMTVATEIWLDLEKRELYHGGYGTLLIDENGNLSEREEPDYPVNDFEYERDRIKDEIKMLWSEVEMSGVIVYDEQYAQYNSIMERVYQVTELWQLYDLLEEARQLRNRVMGIREIMYTDIYGITHNVLEGTTEEAFLAILSDAKFIVYFTDGTEEVYYFDSIMFDISEIDFTNPGEYYIHWSVYVEALDQYIEGSTWVDVIKNVGEGNAVEYKFINRLEGSENVVDWPSITLYENGYALVSDYYGFEFVSYTELDGIIVLTYDGVDLLFELVLDENGDAIGIAYARPETDTVYVFEEDDMYIYFEVFSFDGRWFAFFNAGENESDGSVYRLEITAEIFFNAAGNKFYTELIGEWLEIVDGNRVVYAECDHEFDENGRCIWCGDREGGNTDKECAHVFDDKGCCMYCGIYVGVENVCNHIINEKNYCIYCGMYFEYVVVNHVDNNLDGICDDCGIDLSFGYGENGDASFDDESGEANFGGVSDDSSSENSENGYIVNKIA